MRLNKSQNLVWSWNDIKRDIENMIEEDVNTTFEKCCNSAKLNPHHVKFITKNKEYEAPWTAHSG